MTSCPPEYVSLPRPLAKSWAVLPEKPKLAPSRTSGVDAKALAVPGLFWSAMITYNLSLRFLVLPSWSVPFFTLALLTVTLFGLLQDQILFRPFNQASLLSSSRIISGIRGLPTLPYQFKTLVSEFSIQVLKANLLTRNHRSSLELIKIKRKSKSTLQLFS